MALFRKKVTRVTGPPPLSLPVDPRLAPEPVTIQADGRPCERCQAREAEKILQQGDNWRSSIYPDQTFSRYQLLMYDDQGLIFASGIMAFMTPRSLRKGDQLTITLTAECK